MQNIVVTGATGFLGRHLIKWFLRNTGYNIYAIVRPDSVPRMQFTEEPRVHTVASELKNLEQNIGRFPAKCDAFYHFAWGGVNRDEIDDEAVQQTNVDAALCCVRVAKVLECAVFIDAGSRAEYGNPDGLFSEDTACKPIVAYGRAKLQFCTQARALLQGSDTRLIHARIFSVYGADDHPWSLIYTSVTKMLRNEPVSLGPCTQLWNFMEVEDTCDLLAHFYLEKERIPPRDNGIFNVATRDVRPLKEFVEQIHAITGSHSELLFGTFKQAGGSTFSVVPDMDKVERVFGWRPKIDFETGIRRMIVEMRRRNA